MPAAAIVTICGDAGGAEALAPVLALLQRDGKVTLKNYAYAQAPGVLERASITCTHLDACDVETARQLLGREQAALLLAATSVNQFEFEKQFVVAARQSSCPSLGVLDYWSNYAARFVDENGDIKCAPDALTVMDERAATEVRAAGVPSELTITGQPAFDRLSVHRQGFGADTRLAVRDALGAGPDDLLILFVSQPLDDLYGDAKSRIGFNQHEVLELVMRTLMQLPADRRPTLAVRRHPRERVSPMPATALRIVLDETPNRLDAVLAADLVVGMNSVLLLEASYLGAAVLSLQPELQGDDFLPSNRWRGTEPAYQPDDAIRLLIEYAGDPAARARLGARALTFAPDGRAAGRVCECVHRQLARPAGLAGE